MMEAIAHRTEQETTSPFIVANTNEVSAQHLREDCIIPVFAKDNESTISHTDFIGSVLDVANHVYGDEHVGNPSIRVSHPIKGRIPEAMGKPAKELEEHEKTLYFERMAFLIEVSSIMESIDTEELVFSIGGIRAYNRENLYSRKAEERFKVFVGFRNSVCMNLCVFTDGEALEIKARTTEELMKATYDLFQSFNPMEKVAKLRTLIGTSITERQFAKIIGRLRMSQFMPGTEKEGIMPFRLKDSQINNVVREYYDSDVHGREQDGSLSLWKFYNLLTGANKSSYIDLFADRAGNATQFAFALSDALSENRDFWYLN